MSPSHRRAQRTWLTAAGIAAGLAGLAATVALVPTAQGAEAAAKVKVCADTGYGEHNVKVKPAEAETLYRTTRAYPGPCASYSSALPLGQGRLRTYSQLSGDKPLTLGFVLDRKALLGLPDPHSSDGAECYDLNGDGTVDKATECMHHQNYQLDLPADYTRKSGPFNWALVNWNADGHDPQGVYTTPHFDFHFYIQGKQEREGIRVGPCAGPGMIDCADLVKAQKPVPARYVAPGYADFGAIVAKMGNHLIDANADEFTGKPFTKTFMYGAYDGSITFYEPMITLEYLLALAPGARVCTPLKAPAAWQKAGDYPTEYCVAYRQNRGEITVTLENFVTRAAG